MKVLFKAEGNCYKNEKNHFRLFYLDLIPAITYRHVTGNFGYEYNLYLSWLAWCISITLTKK